MERLWNGASWTDEMRPATIELAPPPDPAQRDGAGDADSRPDGHTGGLHGAADFYHQHQHGIDAAAGLGLIADGALGSPLAAIEGRQRRTGRITGSLSTILVGAVFIAVGVLIGRSQSVPAKMSAATTGTIVALHPINTPAPLRSTTGGLPPTTGCQPVAEYIVNAHTYTATTPATISPCLYSTGAHVTVRYDPSSPSSSQIPSGAEVPTFVPSVAIGLGVVISLFGLLGLLEAAALISTGIWFLSRSRRRT